MPKKQHLSSPLLPKDFIDKIESYSYMRGYKSHVYEDTAHEVRLSVREYNPIPPDNIVVTSEHNLSFSKESRRTYLHFYAMEGDPLAVAEMIGLGANPDLADKEGTTPLHLVFREMAIVKSRALVGSLSTGHDGPLSPVERANVFLRLVLSARLLIEHHANVNTWIDSSSLIDLACEWGHWDLIGLLLHHGAKTTAATASYLHSKADKKRLAEMVRLYTDTPRPPRSCPCWSGKPLRECHGREAKPYPLDYVCICGSGKIYRQCCHKRGQSVLEIWDSDMKLLSQDYDRGQLIPTAHRNQFDQIMQLHKSIRETKELLGLAKDDDMKSAYPMSFMSQESLMEQQKSMAKYLLEQRLMDPAFAYAMDRANFVPQPTGRTSSRHNREEMQQVWNRFIDEYVASGKDSRSIEEITRMAKIGRSGGALIRACEGKDCGKVEGKDVKLHLCSSCKMSCYCSRVCQKSAWSKHKAICGTKDQREQMLPSQTAIIEFRDKLVNSINLPAHLEALAALTKDIRENPDVLK